MSNRLQEALARIDEINAQDPRLVVAEGGTRDSFAKGEKIPKELLYGRRMSAVLSRFAPDAPEAVQLAARAQHIKRWESPRDRYPMTREGYHTWRTELYDFHADTAEAVLREVGYDEDTIKEVRRMLRKRGLLADPERRNPNTQLLEDVICLVFLEYEFAEFAAKHPDEKVIEILQKTWPKMSERAHEAALALPLEGRELELVKKALGLSS